MWLSIFLLLFICRSSLAIENEIDQCSDIIDLEDLDQIENLPNEEMLDTMCPSIVEFMTCLEDVIESHTGFTLEELESVMEGTDKQRYITLLINVRRTLHELCDKDSQLNKDFRANAECFESVQEPDPSGRCLQIASSIVQTYETFENEIEDEMGESDDFNPGCMTSTYQAVCTGMEVREKCGEHAFNTYMKIIGGSTIFRYGICSEDELEEARSKFLDSLDMDSIDRDIYKLAFDLKKRKK